MTLNSLVVVLYEVQSYDQYVIWEMLGIPNLLRRDEYQNDVELIYWNWLKELIKRNATGTNE